MNKPVVPMETTVLEISMASLSSFLITLLFQPFLKK